MRYLITQSLLSSWTYMLSCREECQEDASQEFMNALLRIHKPATPEMQNGIYFENLVYTIADGRFKLDTVPDGAVEAMGDTIVTETPKYPKWYKGANAVATVIKGAPVQVKASRELSVGSMDLLLYGILDALKAGTIYDVKFSNKSFGSAELAGKYLDSPQHSAYFYLIPEAHTFKYLVSDGEDLYTETYTRDATIPFPELAKMFLASLEAMRLLDVYKERWKSK